MIYCGTKKVSWKHSPHRLLGNLENGRFDLASLDSTPQIQNLLLALASNSGTAVDLKKCGR